MVDLKILQLAQRHFMSFMRHNTADKFINLCAIYYHLWRGKTFIKGFPFEIIIDPTNVCDLRCPLCVTGQRKNIRPNGMMPFEEFKKVIDEVGQWLYKVRFYSWGEPLLHKDIYRMISYCNLKNIGTETSTNFYQLGPRDINELIDSGLEYLVISMDGASESTYLKYRIGGDFKRVLNNIQTLIKEKNKKKSLSPTVEIQFLVMKHNEHEIGDIKKLAKELGVDYLRIAPVTLNTKEPKQVKKWLPVNEKWSRYYYRTLEDKIYKKRKRCQWLWRSAVINWDSTISPCCVFEGPKTDLGSLKKETFLKNWNNDLYQASRRTFNNKKNNSLRTRTICTACKGIPMAIDDKQYGLY